MGALLEKVRYILVLKNEQVSDKGHGKERHSGQKELQSEVTKYREGGL